MINRHGIHQEPRHAAVGVDLRGDVDENEVPENDSDSGVGFFGQQIEESRHRVPHRVAVQRHAHGLPTASMSRNMCPPTRRFPTTPTL
jgi:hypothetical protein